MFTRFRKSILILLSLVLVAGIVLAGCGKNEQADGQVFRMNLFSEPPSLDPGTAQDNNSFTVLNAIFEGLTVLDENAEVQKGVAESWDISEDGKTYTFKLRDNAKWSNGDPVKASDFEYAWKRALDPNLDPPSPYAYQLYYIKNAAAYNSGEITDASEVGVKAQDDRTLVVELENPTLNFLKLTAFFTYFPVHQASVQDNPAWSAEADTIISNGPFVIRDWKHSESIVLVPNEQYYGREKVKFDEVRFAMIEESQTEMNMFETGDLDWAGKPVGDIPQDLIPQLREDPEANLQIKATASTYYYSFNTTEEPFKSAKVRKALAMAIDRQLLVDEVTKGGQAPAYGFVSGVTGVEKPYREEVDHSQYFKEDVEEAKKLLQEGLQEQGLSEFPATTLVYNSSDAHKSVATAITDMWRKNLGIEVGIEAQEFGVLLSNRSNLNFQIARAGWGADYDDPMTFMDIFQSSSGNNDTGWKNPEYDKLIQAAYAETDNVKRMGYIAEAEKMLMEDMVIMPIYYYTSVWMSKPYVKNVFMDYAGNIHFNFGYIEK